MSKLVAVAYGISGFAGLDNELGVDDLSIPVEEATSLSEMNRRWTESRMEAYDCEDATELNEKIHGNWPIGFWLLERGNFEIAMVPKTIGLQRHVYPSDLHWFTSTIDQQILELLSRLKISRLGADPDMAKELAKISKNDLIRQILGIPRRTSRER